jgi:hypothetical protein
MYNMYILYVDLIAYENGRERDILDYPRISHEDFNIYEYLFSSKERMRLEELFEKKKRKKRKTR